MSKELKTAQRLAEMSNELAELGTAVSAMMMQMMILSQGISALQARVQAVTHFVLDAPPPERFEENTSFGVAENPENPNGAMSPKMEPPAHDGREAAYSAGNGTDDRASGTTMATASAGPPQSVQAVHGDASADAGASPEVPAIYDLVLQRFAETGHSHNELATAFDVGLGVISRCLTIARASRDRRAAAGDLKRAELMEGREPSPPAAARR